MSIQLSPVLEQTTNDHLGVYCRGCKMTHMLRVVPDPENSKTPKWQFNGDVNKPSFHPSYTARYSRDGKVIVCHSWIKNGTMEYMGDCTHELRGQTVDLPPLSEEATI